MSLLTNLIEVWDFEAAGGANNETGTFAGKVLTQHNSPGSTTGILSNARTLVQASSQYFSRATETDLVMDTGGGSPSPVDFTITCWCKFTTVSPPSQIVFGKYSNASNEYAIVVEDSSPSHFSFYAGIGFNKVAAGHFGQVPTGTWCFVACWQDGTSGAISISVNDGTVNSVSGTGWTGGNAEFQVGNRDGQTAFMDGAIDQSAIWKGRILTAGEITRLYNGGAGLPFSQWATADDSLPTWYTRRQVFEEHEQLIHNTY